MTTLATLNRKSKSLACGCCLSLVWHSDIGIHTTSTTYIQFALGLRVEVEQNLSLQQATLQAKGTIHAGLLGSGNKTLDRAVLYAIILHNGQDSRYADTVISTERCAVSRHPLAIDICLDGVVDKVEHLVVILLWHHIHVSLNNDTLSILITRCSGL